MSDNVSVMKPVMKPALVEPCRRRLHGAGLGYASNATITPAPSALQPESRTSMKSLLLAPHLAMRLLAALSLPLLVSGCGVSSQLHLSDPSSTNVSARALHRFGGGPGGSGIEVEASSLRAQGEQTLNAAQLATLNNVTISGPGGLQHKSRVEHAQLTYNHLHFAGRPMELEWFVGAAWVHTTWETVNTPSSALRLSQQSRWTGPTAGAQGRLRLGEQLSLELRHSGAINLSGPDSGSRNSTSLSLAFKPVPVLALRLGFGEVRTFYRPEFNSSELSLRARGPFLNLGLEL
jgi:hypothetical protein